MQQKPKSFADMTGQTVAQEESMVIPDQTVRNGAGIPKISFDFSGILRDVSFWALLFSNLFSIYFITKNHVPVRTVMLMYWMQSVSIGMVNIIRILSLTNFSTKGYASNGSPVTQTTGSKISSALFFMVHYGFFHLGYLMFIGTQVDWGSALLVGGVFFGNHLFSLLYNFKAETDGKNLGLVMMAPYARIVPMHLAIVMGTGMSGASLGILLALKTAVDMVSHVIKHAVQIRQLR